MTRSIPRVGVVAFPGSHDAAATRDALVRMGAEVVALGPDDGADRLRDLDVVVLPGGWSYGDGSRPGARAAATPVVAAARAVDATLVGIGDGFAVLCEAGILPGRVDIAPAIECDDLAIEVTEIDTPLTRGMRVGDLLVLPVHGRALRWAGDGSPARVVLQRVDDRSVVAIAAGRAVGALIHPELAVDPDRGPTDGQAVLASLLGTVEP